jgi:ABC-2 type transport system ATP-binding protein
MIEIEELTKKFGNFIAVDRTSFKVSKGEIFGLLGPNGAGKSTIIRMLCTLLRPSEGKAKVAGFDVVEQPSQVREHIGLVTEKVILYDRLTAMENLILFGRLNHMPEELIKERSERWLRLLQMWDWRDKRIGTFSTGMKQRINIARALLHQPDVLFLDEPTLGLDPQTTRSIREFIQELSQEGITIVLTTHIMVEAEMLCHRVGIIDLGRIVALDTPTSLKRAISNDETTILDIEVLDLDSGLISKLKSLDCVTSLLQNDSYQIRIHARGEEAIDKIINLVREEGKRIRAISSIEPTLEDVFLHLTGREMRDEAKEKIPSRHGRHWRRPRVQGR